MFGAAPNCRKTPRGIKRASNFCGDAVNQSRHARAAGQQTLDHDDALLGIASERTRQSPDPQPPLGRLTRETLDVAG
jgi:hypothetical protein